MKIVDIPVNLRLHISGELTDADILRMVSELKKQITEEISNSEDTPRLKSDVISSMDVNNDMSDLTSHIAWVDIFNNGEDETEAGVVIHNL